IGVGSRGDGRWPCWGWPVSPCLWLRWRRRACGCGICGGRFYRATKGTRTHRPEVGAPTTSPHDATPRNPVYLAALTSLPISSFMELVRGLHNLRPRHRGCVATIGNFDGVHAGHRAILERLKTHGERLGMPVCVVSFYPQPREFFAPQSAPPRLTRLRDKLALLEEQGVDRVLCLAFNRRLRELAADEFIQQVLIDGLGVKHLEVG